MDLEKLATSAVEDSISMTETMSPFINDGDKEPVWDGMIYIYEDSRKRKDGIKRVPVQVKGKECNKQDSDVIKYSVEISCLKDYANDGGVLFFVVYIDSSGTRKQIYYSSLPKVKIINILEGTKGKKKVSIELTKFPDDNDEKTTIILNLYDHIKKQTSFFNGQLFSLEELEGKGLIDSITFSFTKYGKRPFDVCSMMLENDYMYLYAKLKNLDITVPLKDIFIDSHIYETTSIAVKVGDVVFYKEINIIRSKNEVVFRIGDSLRIKVNTKSNSNNIKILPTTILEKALIDLPFLIALIRFKTLDVGDWHNDFSGVEKFPSTKEIDWIQKNLYYCLRLSRLFDYLHINKNYDLTQMTDLDRFNASKLYSALIEYKVVSGYKINLPILMPIEFAQKSIALIFWEQETKGTYKITDFFKDDIFHVYRDVGDIKYTVSKYVILSIEDLLNFTNIDFDDIFDSFKNVSVYPQQFEDTNAMVLNLLSAYDKSKDKRDDILECAYNLAEWMLTMPEFESESKINILNFLQVVKRKSELSEEQKLQLTEIAEDISQNVMNRVAANLLLDNHSSARFHFNKLSEQEKEQFQKFPIYRFWRD